MSILERCETFQALMRSVGIIFMDGGFEFFLELLEGVTENVFSGIKILSEGSVSAFDAAIPMGSFRG